MPKKKAILLASGTIDLETMKVVECEEMGESEYRERSKNPPIKFKGDSIKIESNKMKTGESWLIEYLGRKFIIEKGEGGVIDIWVVTESS